MSRTCEWIPLNERPPHPDPPLQRDSRYQILNIMIRSLISTFYIFSFPVSLFDCFSLIVHEPKLVLWGSNPHTHVKSTRHTSTSKFTLWAMLAHIYIFALPPERKAYPHHPRVNFRFASNFSRRSDLVKKSALWSTLAILMISMLFGLSLLLNQWYLIPYHFDLGDILPGSNVANFRAPALSSQTVVRKWVMGSWVSPTFSEISVAIILMGNTSLIAVDSALMSFIWEDIR
jgi:hypothetical protein